MINRPRSKVGAADAYIDIIGKGLAPCIDHNAPVQFFKEYLQPCQLFPGLPACLGVIREMKDIGRAAIPTWK